VIGASVGNSAGGEEAPSPFWRLLERVTERGTASTRA